MTTTIPNTRASQSINIDQIEENIDKAQRCFVSSKDSASEAAAHLYVVWDDTMSPFANADAKKWIEDQIEARNRKIDEHNEKVASERERAKAFKEGTLNKYDLVNIKPANDADRKAVDEERARLTSLADLTDNEWTARRKVPVKAQANSSPFTGIVKFGLNFDSPDQASVTSRYATVLAWIHAHFEGVGFQDASEIVTAIKVAGGFEAVLIEQRNKGESGGSKGAAELKIEAEESKIIADAISAKAKAAVQTAPAIATIDMQISDANQDIVVLIGRYADGKVEVVDEIPLEEGEIDSTLSRLDADLLLPTNDSSEFVARVLALGDLVEEGKVTTKTRDGTVAGQNLKEQRTFSLLRDAKGNTQLMISSASHAESSVVIKAWPDTSRVSLGEARVPMVMSRKSQHDLEKMLSDRAIRRLIDIVATDDSAGAGAAPTQPLSWIASNSALIAKNHATGRRTFFWEDMTQRDFKPLDINNFCPQVNVSVSAADMVKLYEQRLKIWRGKENDRLMTLRFHDAFMICKVEGAGACDILRRGDPCARDPAVSSAQSARSRAEADAAAHANLQRFWR